MRPLLGWVPRSHAPRGNARWAAPRPEPKPAAAGSLSVSRRGAAKTAFPRGAWERGLFSTQVSEAHTASGCVCENAGQGGWTRLSWRPTVAPSRRPIFRIFVGRSACLMRFGPSPAETLRAGCSLKVYGPLPRIAPMSWLHSLRSRLLGSIRTGRPRKRSGQRPSSCACVCGHSKAA